MKKSKFMESQIVFALKQSETGVKVEEICRKMGISEATYYNWKKKYGDWVFLSFGGYDSWKKKTASSKNW